jgi:hypothetical protein
VLFGFRRDWWCPEPLRVQFEYAWFHLVFRPCNAKISSDSQSPEAPRHTAGVFCLVGFRFFVRSLGFASELAALESPIEFAQRSGGYVFAASNPDGSEPALFLPSPCRHCGRTSSFQEFTEADWWCLLSQEARNVISCSVVNHGRTLDSAATESTWLLVIPPTNCSVFEV